MRVLILAACLALAEPGSEEAVAPVPPGPDLTELQERLLGEPEPPRAQPLPPPSNTLPSTPLWPVPFVILAIGVLLVLRRRGFASLAEGAERDLRVVQRTTLTPGTQAAVVEVRDTAGTWRRLLVGMGAGAPTVLAELGEVGEAADSEPRIARPFAAHLASLQTHDDPIEALALATPTPPAPRSKPAPQPGTPAAQSWSRRTHNARADAARALVDEVLADREGEGDAEAEAEAEAEEKPAVSKSQASRAYREQR
jgi:hypothetical protein